MSKKLSRTAQVLAGTALAWSIVLSGCGGDDGGPDTQPTATGFATVLPTISGTASGTATAIGTTTATASGTPAATGTGTPAGTLTGTPAATATGTAISGATGAPTPNGTASPIAPLQFRGFYVGTVSTGSVPTNQITFRVNAQGQVSGQVIALNASGIGQTLPLRGTLSVASNQVNNPSAQATLDLNASGVSGNFAVSYRLSGAVSLGGLSAGVVSGTGTATTVFGSDTITQTVQITRQSV